ncbi:MAG: hypothetical protein BIFFINMI_01941 [Phycisphaerae bacterium]|nr:hypothetical protein [Phycisphaerae bacterium]
MNVQPPRDAGPEDEPYVPASRSLPELTVKAVVLGVALSVILGAANAYLGLFAGMTVSASIPAAVISMGLLRLFRGSNILENNIVQTAASAGESVAAGVIFTIPALVMMGAWSDFSYWETTIIAGLGGLIGVLFTIPLRRALIVEHPLRFPEGVATAEVLKVGDRAGAGGARGVKLMALAAVAAALFKLAAEAIAILPGVVQGAVRRGRALAYGGVALSPMLLGVGYIVGLNIAALVFLGGAIDYLVAIPIVHALGHGPADGTALERVAAIYRDQTRFIGVGAMLVGGFWALLRMGGPLARGVRASISAYRHLRTEGSAGIDRTERDTPFHWVVIGTLVAVVPLYFLFDYVTGRPGVAALMAVVMLAAAFLFSAIAAYMAGLVGSSSNPISGVTMATVMVAALLLLVLVGRGHEAGPAAAIFIGAVVCCAAAIGGDNMQDLKAGRLVGATPWKQQLMEAVGVVAAAFVIAPVLKLLNAAHPIGQPGGLAAPQASVMASIARGVFARDLPWAMIAVGGAVAVAIILADLWLASRKATFRMPVLAVAVGIYLPFHMSVPIFAGGLIAAAAARRHRSRNRPAGQGGLLFAAGLITGEAIMGILIAIPAALGWSEKIAIGAPWQCGWAGVLLLLAVAAGLWSVASRPSRESA